MRKLVTIENILEKRPIEGADRIEAVRCRDWWVVAIKDQFNLGDKCLFYEIDSFLPDKPEYEFLRKGKSLKRMVVDNEIREGILLKTIKLRGQLSQGLVMPIPDGLEGNIGDDVSEALGVIKYEVPLPAALVGKAKGFFPSFIPKTDEERIQNMAEVLSGYYATEKLDGQSVTFFKKDGVFGVCSRNLEIAEGDTTQWRMAKKYDLENKLSDNLAIQCELIGEGIQSNRLIQGGQDIYCFNVYNIMGGNYLGYYEFRRYCDSIGVKTVPVIDENFALPNTVEEVLKFAEGKSLLNLECEREGVVIRPKVETMFKGQRLSFKAISNAYLLKEE